LKGRTTKLIVSIVVVAMVAVWICAAVCAQGGGGGAGGGGNRGGANRGGFGGQGFGGGAPAVKVGTQGIFVLTGGTLTKYDTKLKEQGTIKFVEPAPPASTDSSDTAAPPRRQMPRSGVVLIAPNADPAKEKVLVVYGTDFFSIDAATFKVAAKCKIPDPEPPAGAAPADPNAPGGGMGARMMGGFFGAPTLELSGNILYVIRGTQMLAINIDDASIVGKATLPQQAPPVAPANPGQ